METAVLIEVVALSLTLMSLVGAAVWTVATVRAMVNQLTASIDRLTARIDAMEVEHGDMRERVARLEGSNK